MRSINRIRKVQKTRRKACSNGKEKQLDRTYLFDAQKFLEKITKTVEEYHKKLIGQTKKTAKLIEGTNQRFLPGTHYDKPIATEQG